MHEIEAITEIVGAQRKPGLGDEVWNKYLDEPEADQSTEDVVNHPSHYTSHRSGIECLSITRCLPFSLGNAIKYLWRAGLKGGKEKQLEDWKKALFYLRDHQQNFGKVYETFNLHVVIAKFHAAVTAKGFNPSWEDLVIDSLLSMHSSVECWNPRPDRILQKAIDKVNAKVLDAETEK